MAPAVVAPLPQRRGLLAVSHGKRRKARRVGATAHSGGQNHIRLPRATTTPLAWVVPESSIGSTAGVPP